MWQKTSQWLWGNRKELIIAGGAFALLQLVFNQTSNLYLWLGLMGLLLSVGTWWVSGFSYRSKRLWMIIAQMLWTAGAAIGFIVFNLVTQLQFQVTALATMALIFWLLEAIEYYSVEGVWPIRVMPFLDFADLLAFFFLGTAILLAGDYYSLSTFWLSLVFAIQTVFALYLRFWREQLVGLRKWLYVLVGALLIQEIVWVGSFWHRGVYLKTFLAAIVFYLIADFIVYYMRGRLTVKVALEYLGLVVLVLVGVMIVDGILVLR